MNTLLDEIEAHHSRLKLLAKTSAANVTVAQLVEEIGETLMPLLRDFASVTFGEVLSMRQYLHKEVEPMLAAAAGEDSALLPEDAQLLTTRLVAYRTILEQMQLQADIPADRQAQLATEIGETDKALALVAEITLDEEEDDPEDEDPEEEDPEDEDPEDDEADATPTRQ